MPSYAVPIHIAEEERIRREHAEYISLREIDAIDELHVDNSILNSKNELSDNEASDFNNPSFPRPPPEPPEEEFDFEIDSGEEISVVRNTIFEFECLDPRVEFDDKNEDYSSGTNHFVEIPSGEIKVDIEVLSVLWGNRLLIRMEPMEDSRLLHRLLQLKSWPSIRDCPLSLDLDRPLYYTSYQPILTLGIASVDTQLSDESF
nr:hypothetical protein [Tanacetum cinerariifolium]